MSTGACPICHDQSFTSLSVREMMLGTREVFRYGECHSCRCLFLIEPPTDMGRYYPQDYYSFHEFTPNLLQRIRTYVKYKSLFSAATGKGLVGRIILTLFGKPYYACWLELLQWTKDSRILDVGCGSGMLVRELYSAGFTAVEGIDPFLSESVIASARLPIRTADIFDIQPLPDEKFDCIMFHHSFEHVPLPQDVLLHAVKLLRKNGRIVIRVPVADSFAYREYGTDWVQLDAPRHYILHTQKSMAIIAQQSGLTIEHTIYDSTDFQFWGSELYQRNCSLHEIKSPESYFDKNILQEFKKKADTLNASGQGDQACFILKQRV